LFEALQRPAFLVDAFDQSAVISNRRVKLSDIACLFYWVGGLPAQLIRQGAGVMRAGGDDYKTRALDMLSHAIAVNLRSQRCLPRLL
jgi:hypothetical protein